MFCPQCGVRQPDDHRFCFSCGRQLPHDLVAFPGGKVSRWFLAVPIEPDERPGSALRVTRYAKELVVESAEGTVVVPANHVRLSFWVEDQVVCGLSLADDEAESLAKFLLGTSSDPRGTPRANASS